MNILQKVLNKKPNLKSVVRIGSNYLNVSVEKDISCKQFVSNCLKKCKLNVVNFPNGYNLFLKNGESEKLVPYDSNLYQVLKNLIQNDIEFELLIRKCQIAKVNRIKKIKNLKLKKQKKIDITFRSATHYYEDIDANAPTTQMNLTRTISNPKLNRLIPKSLVYNLRTIHRIREKFKTKIVDFEEIFI